MWAIKGCSRKIIAKGRPLSRGSNALWKLVKALKFTTADVLALERKNSWIPTLGMYDGWHNY